MRIQPRHQLVEVWRALARYSFHGDEWRWGGRAECNSVSDAEQLLCLLGPATELARFGLDAPDDTERDVAAALRPLGDSVEVPQTLLGILRQYLVAYTDADGNPIFGGGSYFTTEAGGPPSEAQRALDVVDSFAASIRLMLAVLGFLRTFRVQVRRQELLDRIAVVESLAGRRLTAAMIGLLRGFTVNVFDAGSTEDRILIATANQDGQPAERVRQALLKDFADIRAGLREVTLGEKAVAGLDNPHRLFECGWSWGVTRTAAPIATRVEHVRQPVGYAEDAPYLYFTVVALDCIQQLFGPRTRQLGLLDEEQSRLARLLQIRYDLTLSYWSRLARHGERRWPLQDVPWTTTDNTQSDYYSLLIASMVVLDLTGRATPEDQVARVVEILVELAQRARITRRTASEADPAVELHHPGFGFDLVGSELAGGSRLRWHLTDFSTQLVKQALRLARQERSPTICRRLTDLTDEVWQEHLLPRRIRAEGPDGAARTALWDQLEAVYPQLPAAAQGPSWYYTERVVGCLTAAAHLIDDPLPSSPSLVEHAAEMLAEAERLYSREQMRVAVAGPSLRESLDDIEANLRRAKELRKSQPGTAVALTQTALVELERLASARHDGGKAY